ncbi:MAG: biotin transporter BioY [bacterium]|nr:biotin transporter BioY [bacterium]
MKLTTKEITVCGMFSALIAVGAFLRIDIPMPLYTMHFTMQWFFVLMAGMLLGVKLGTMSVIVYLCIGLIGIPVFAAGGGPAYVFRPGFGFLLGFVFAAWVMGLIVKKMNATGFSSMLLASVTGLVIYYCMGAVYFYLIKNLYVGEAVSWKVVIVQYCLITVLPDFILCVLASLLSVKIKPHFQKILEG